MQGARTPEEAATRFADALNGTVSCVTDTRLWIPRAQYAEGERYAVTFGTAGDPVRLRAKPSSGADLNFNMVQTFTLVREHGTGPHPAWRVSTISYAYSILALRETELLVCHWQPDPGAGGPRHPHLHVSAAVMAHSPSGSASKIGLDKMHTPTGPVALESVIRHLVEDWSIAPLGANWRDMLGQSEQEFRDVQTRHP